MKSRKLNKWGLAVLLNALMVPVLAGVESPFEVGTWGNFCDGAISHTFDDNTAGQISTAQPMFDEKGFKMTFFICTGWGADWSNLKKAFEKGHEIASHTVDHSSSSQGFRDAKKKIQDEIPGEMCITVAYPNCQQNGVDISPYYIAGRNCDGAVNSAKPQNFAQISSTLVGYGSQQYSPKLNTASQFNQIADNAISSKGWATTCHHGFGSDNHDFANTDANEFKEHLDYLDQNRDKIWCETFGNVARYIKERDAVSLSVTSSDDNSITVSVTDNLDNSIYNYPLSIRRPLPDGWTDPVVTQDGEEVEFSVEDNNIVFKAVPDGGEVVISRDPVRALKHLSHKNSSSCPVVLKNSVLLIDQQYFNGSELAVTIFNLTGKMLGSYKTGKNESRIVLPAGKINRAAFVAKITGKDKTLIQKFMPQM